MEDFYGLRGAELAVTAWLWRGKKDDDDVA